MAITAIYRVTNHAEDEVTKIDRHSFYQEFLLDQDLGYNLTVKTWGRHDEICVLSVQRDKAYGQATRREVELLRKTAVHIAARRSIGCSLNEGLPDHFSPTR